jgi:ABC-2 type transport system ATP-binding protein
MTSNNSSEEIAIKVDNVSKSFSLPHEKRGSIKSLFVNLFRGRRTFEKQQVLKDISFEIKKGEFFGIVGRNGSGKSTLLKLLAGIYAPDSGNIRVNGKLTPFIELGVGFSPDLTGRENVFLNGALLGFKRREMEAMYNDIVEFAELERFMDQKLKNYSSGMQVRLAFSIAIRARSDILVLDEVLAVGDAAFQRKCFNYFKQLKADKKTVVLVTHDMSAVQEFCDKAMIIKKDFSFTSGDPDDIALQYSEINFENDKTKEKKQTTSNETDKKVNILTLKSDKTTYTARDKFVSISAETEITQDIEGLVLGMQVSNVEGVPIFGTNNESLKEEFRKLEKGTTFVFESSFDNILNNGTYSISCAVKSQDRLEIYAQIIEGPTFEVSGRTRQEGSGAAILPHSNKVSIKKG